MTKGDRRGCSGAKDGIDFSGFSLLLGKWGNQGFHKLDDVISKKQLPASLRAPFKAIKPDQDADFAAFASRALPALQSADWKGGSDASSKSQKFLNRLLGVKPALQKPVFALYKLCVEEVRRNARAAGNAVDDLGAIELKDDVSGGGVTVVANWKVAHAHDLPPSRVATIDHDGGLPFAAATAKLAELKEDAAGGRRGGELPGFFLSHRNRPGYDGDKHVVLARRAGAGSGAVYAMRPNGRNASMYRENLDENYTSCTAAEAEAAWEHEFAAANRHCSHGPNCKLGPSCTVGRRIQRKAVVAGSFLPFWPQLEQQCATKGKGKDGGGVRLQIVRGSLGGEKLVGVEVPATGVAAFAEKKEGAPEAAAPDAKAKGKGKAKKSAAPGAW